MEAVQSIVTVIVALGLLIGFGAFVVGFAAEAVQSLMPWLILGFIVLAVAGLIKFINHDFSGKSSKGRPVAKKQHAIR